MLLSRLGGIRTTSTTRTLWWQAVWDDCENDAQIAHVAGEVLSAARKWSDRIYDDLRDDYEAHPRKITWAFSLSPQKIKIKK